MRKASGPAKQSARWRKEVAQARNDLQQGLLAAAAHAGLYVLPTLLAGIGAPILSRDWPTVLAVTTLLLGLGYLMRRGMPAAALLLLVAAPVGFAAPLVQGHGLSLEMGGLIAAWFYFQGLRATLALRRRLHAPAVERDG